MFFIFNIFYRMKSFLMKSKLEEKKSLKGIFNSFLWLWVKERITNLITQASVWLFVQRVRHPPIDPKTKLISIEYEDFSLNSQFHRRVICRIQEKPVASLWTFTYYVTMKIDPTSIERIKFLMPSPVIRYVISESSHSEI